VNLGGDVRVDGASPEDAGWLVGVEDPFGDEPAAILSVRSGAVATTSRLTRVLAAGHHVIDPETGAPARTGLASATAVAAEGWQAEILAKAAFLAGPVEGRRLLAGRPGTAWSGTTGILIDDGGVARRAAGLDRYEVLPEGSAA